MGENCIFCDIASKKAEASIVYEDEQLVAFMDIHPVNIGHTIVVPRRHWETIYELPETIIGGLFVLVKRIAMSVKQTVDADGVNVLQSNEEAAFQSVKHFHVHIIPRFEGDKMTKVFQAVLIPMESEKVSRVALDEIAERIRENL